MSSARERAREAAEEVVALVIQETLNDALPQRVPYDVSALYDENGNARSPGDAASEVWETNMRAIRDLLNGQTIGDHAKRISAALVLIKEVLGE